MEETISLFIDGAGRYILGVILSQNDVSLTVKNPAIIVVNAGPNGQVQVQTIPLFFKELIHPSQDSTVWDFPITNCVLSHGAKLSEQLIAQYSRAINPPPPPSQTAQQPQTVKLFDQ